MRRSFISLAAFLVAAVSVASGQCLFSDFIPMGEETHTIQIAEMELIDSVTNTAYILASSGGTITVSVLGSSTNLCSLSFLPVALSLTTTHPLFGVVTTTLDPAQYFGPSTASSSPGLVTFPAIEHLYLPIEIRMSSRPGVGEATGVVRSTSGQDSPRKAPLRGVSSYLS